jgi:putative hydrolase of the HAD superfamily
MHAGVLFDLDETLVDRRGSLSRYASQLWHRERHAITLAEPEFVKRFHRIDNAARTPRKEFFRSLAAELLPVFSAAGLEEDFYTQAWASPLLFDGVEHALTNLRQRGYRIGIVSNGGERAQSAKIRNSPLRELVDAFLISGSFGAEKPHPSIYAEAVARLDLDVSRSWFVGDDPVADVVGSTRAGFKAIWVQRHAGWPDTEPLCYAARIRRIAELLDVIPLAPAAS